MAPVDIDCAPKGVESTSFVLFRSKRDGRGDIVDLNLALCTIIVICVTIAIAAVTDKR